MNFTKNAIATLLTISAVIGLPTTASANVRLDSLNQQTIDQAEVPQSEVPKTSSPQITQPQSEIPKTTRAQQVPQASIMTQKEGEINVKDISPEYCRYLFPSSGTVSLFEYFEGLYRCQHGD